MSAPKLLILGGTGEAAVLADAARARFGEAIEITTSLAGRTMRPAPIAGHVRIGGFGGEDGLAAYLAGNRIDRLIDATHPFAQRISHQARLACERAGVARLILLRSPWKRHPGDRWIEVDTMAQAAEQVGRIGRRAWLTVGAGEIAAFAAVDEVSFVVRLIDPPRSPLPLARCEVIFGRGPFGLAEERRRIESLGIDVLVAKASGGDATAAKIVAARELGLPVIIVRRPPPEPGPAATTVEAALAWLDGAIKAAEARGVR